MTRAELCIAACEGLSDADLKLIVAAGGLRHVVDTGKEVEKVMSFAEAVTRLPHALAQAKGDVFKLRPLLIHLLAAMEQLAAAPARPSARPSSLRPAPRTRGLAGPAPTRRSPGSS